MTLIKRDSLECVRQLFEAPEFIDYLLTEPVLLFADDEQEERIFHEMNTCNWWFDVQEAIEERAEGGTLVPVILSLDKTLLTTYGGKEAYPVYLTIGNIPKALRKKVSFRSQILVAYLPADKLSNIENKEIQKITTFNLYQACLADILEPLKEAGRDGVFWRTADGAIRRCHPIIAAFVVDHIEQANITGTLQYHCPICTCPSSELGDHSTTHELRDPAVTKAAVLLQFQEDDPRAYTLRCDELKIRPLLQNWWMDFPYLDPYPCNTPEVLHQIYTGMIAHVLDYLEIIVGRSELNFRSRILPPCFGMRSFSKGICELSNPTGMESIHFERAFANCQIQQEWNVLIYHQFLSDL